MIYWLIPYLVAYNASDAGHWRYGPEHVFKAEVRGVGTTENLSKFYTNVDVHLVCRPMNSSLIQCRVESSMIDNWSVDADGTSSSESHSFEPFDIGNVVFQVEFNGDGVSNLWLLNTKGRFRHDMLRAIFGTIHWGIGMFRLEYGGYDRVEKSMIGTCETTFDVGKKPASKEEIKAETTIDGYSFDVPGFEGRSKAGPIIIEKNRHTDRCSEKTLYLFGNSGSEEFDLKHGLKKKIDVISSRSRIYLGKNSFSGYTRDVGTWEISSSRVKPMKSIMNIDQTIHLGLEAIRPANEDIRQMMASANGDAGSVEGTRWPKEDAPPVKFFM